MRPVILGVLIALIGIGAAFRADRAEAATPPGLDVSWPQCGKRLPKTPQAFAVVGVDGGKAFTTNPCFRDQYRWASSTGTMPSLYMTLRSPQGPTASKGHSGPAGECGASDQHCISYNYGYRAAEAAFAHAEAQVAAPLSTMWWLDIETMSHWSKNQAANRRVVEGAIGYLTERGVMIGVYSTRQQWEEITGGFAAGLPVWIGGASDAAEAPTFCVPQRSFNGGPIWMIQYVANDLDHNVICGEPLAITILTRNITSAGAARTAAALAKAAETPPPAVEHSEAPLPPPAPPSPPPELAHVGGVGLQKLPVVSISGLIGCGLPAYLATYVESKSAGRELTVDRPRTETERRRRRFGTELA